MAVERLKVRCYRCNQLLAVAPTKAGAIVACPKCQAELLIPSPESDAGPEPKVDGPGSPAVKSPPPRTSASASASPSAGTPSFLNEIAGMLPPEVAELRPEDLRVEAEFFESLTHEPPATASPEPVPLPASWSPDPEPPGEELSPFIPPAPGGPSVVLDPLAENPATIETPPPIPLPKPVVDLPPIEIEPPTILPPGTEIRRVREVVLPASVVLAWSLFVLAAVAMSFVAGLMIGHFLWKNVP